MARRYKKTHKWYKSRLPRIKNKKKIGYYKQRIKILEKRVKTLEKKLSEEKQQGKLKREDIAKRRKAAEKRRQKRFEEKIERREPITSLLKKEHISVIKTDYARMMQNEKRIYKALLYKALLKPKEYTELIIKHIDAIKQHLETELEFIEYTKEEMKTVANMVIAGKTLQEIKEKMQELGIKPEQVLDSGVLKEIAERLGAKSSRMNDKGRHRIKQIRITVRLVKGKV